MRRKKLKAYRCSECALLQDLDEIVMCSAGIDPRIGYREKNDADLCKKSFELLPENKQWHEKFSWE